MTKDEPSQAVMTLETALAAVRQRHGNYGPPDQHFARTVGLINALLGDKLREPLTPADWAQIMILDKISRHQGPGRHIDNPVDICGYAACLAEVDGCQP